MDKAAQLSIGCNAIMFDATRQQVLLLRRADNGWWCLPGGMMNAGECSGEAGVREVLEEAGLQVRIKRPVGVYSDPHHITECDDGHLHQIGHGLTQIPRGFIPSVFICEIRVPFQFKTMRLAYI